MKLSEKTVWTSIGVVFLVLFWFWEPEQFDESFRSILGVAIRMVMLAIAAGMAYQAYDSIRSSVTGTHPRTSKPEDNPTAISARLAGFSWGLICSSISLGLGAFALGFLGGFPQ